MNKRLKTAIPEEFLLKMGTHNVSIHGVNVTAHVVDSKAVVNRHITSFRDHLQSTTKVVGIDIKKLFFRRAGINYYTTPTLILCVFGRCLIIHLDCVSERLNNVVDALDSLLGDPEICFVGIKTLMSQYSRYFHETNCVEAGELAARVLKNPPLIKWSLSNLAQKVGVPYKASLTQTTDIEVDSEYPKVYSDEQVIAAVSDAYANFQIGFKLLNSLPSSDAKPKPKPKAFVFVASLFLLWCYYWNLEMRAVNLLCSFKNIE